MLTRVIEVLIDVLVASLVIFMHDSGVSILIVDFNFLHGCIIISLDRLLDHERLLLY